MGRPRLLQQPQSSWWVLILVLRTFYDPSAMPTRLTHLFRFTSVAFAHSESPGEVKLVQSWPHNNGRSADQVPTEVQYTNPLTRSKVWGYEVSNNSQGADPLKWFKLLLHEKDTPATSQTPASSRGSQPVNLDALFQTLVVSAGLSSSLVTPAVTPAQETAQKLRKLKITPLQVVTDFLASVRDLAVAEIGTSYQTKWVQGQKIEYVLTIPGKLNRPYF
jgi:hypothetical protein